MKRRAPPAAGGDQPVATPSSATAAPPPPTTTADRVARTGKALAPVPAMTAAAAAAAAAEQRVTMQLARGGRKPKARPYAARCRVRVLGTHRGVSLHVRQARLHRARHASRGHPGATDDNVAAVRRRLRAMRVVECVVVRRTEARAAVPPGLALGRNRVSCKAVSTRVRL